MTKVALGVTDEILRLIGPSTKILITEYQNAILKMLKLLRIMIEQEFDQKRNREILKIKDDRTQITRVSVWEMS